METCQVLKTWQVSIQQAETMRKNERYINEFKEEALERLSDIETNLLGMENRARPPGPDQVNGIFRGVHSIKGAAGFLGLNQIGDLSHIMETLLSMIRSGDLIPDQECIDALLSGVDILKTMVNQPESSDKTDITRERSRLKRIVMNRISPETGEKMETRVALLDLPGENAGFEIDEYTLNNIPSSMSLYVLKFDLKMREARSGESPVALIQRLASTGEIIESRIDAPLDDLHRDMTNVPLMYEVLYATFMDFDMVSEETGLETDCIVPVPPERFKAGREETVKEPDDDPEDSGAAVPESPGGIAFENRPSNRPEATADTENGSVEDSHEPENKTGTFKEERRSSSIRVPESKMDRLVELAGELLTVHSGLALEAKAQPHNRKLVSIAESMSRLTGELRHITLGLRMTPIAFLFDQYERFTRDLSMNQGKRIMLTTEGAETELDKKMIEQIDDPLRHIIRNSIDHGVETVSERIGLGKPERAVIHLSALQSGGNVLITVADDGRGLDTENIRSHAEKQGIIDPGVSLSDSEIYSLIFEPGFSTADTVTSVSGRGVGMDAVKQAVENLRGRIDIKSRKHRGVSITLSIPMTLAIIDGLTVRISDAYFVFPLFVVHECVSLGGEDLKRAGNRNMMDFRGRATPYIHLRKRFNVDGTAPDSEIVVIVQSGDGFIGFGVDRVVGEHKTVVKSLGKLYQDIEGVSGGTVMGDGSVALIVDVGHSWADGVRF